ncbi:DrmB family protein [Streptomyces sp. NPDC099088]|uniref:DrmB family protein n=1 Tax=Streptomyces sp. NPDC099088 TaxID=3366101 RepID=UPI00381F2CC4
MTQPRRRRRTGSDLGSAAPRRTFPVKGAVRRAQMITTYGVGGLIAVDNESFIISGLDNADRSWSRHEAQTITEPRLANLLGVSHFRLPPASGDESEDGVRVKRFPWWQSCSTCGLLAPYKDFGSPADKSVCPTCSDNPLVPSRFVMACEHGHIEDFPYWKWLHRKERGEGASGGKCGGVMRLRSTGTTTSLRSVILSCSCGVADMSMEGSFRQRALGDLGITCSGRRPWLDAAPAQNCTQSPRTLQRGSSAVWQPVLRSALSIPPYSKDDELTRTVLNNRDDLAGFTDPEDLRRAVRMLLKRSDFDLDVVTRLLEDDAPGQDSTLEARYRLILRGEYDSLAAGNATEVEQQDHDEDFVCVPPKADLGLLAPFGLTDPMLVKRLREVRALTSFTRIVDAQSAGPAHQAQLSLQRKSWLPALEVRGEGVFLRLAEDRLHAWERDTQAASRISELHANHTKMLREYHVGEGEPHLSPASPRYTLLHTLAHVLITEWSLDAGYPSSALRERLYCDNDMAGLLVYTATSDSAGSLGGLVAQGEPKNLTDILESALRRASWCSADPLCIESRATGVGGANHAACHACVMLAETSCETNNLLLDRALLVGTPDDPNLGYFTRTLNPAM